jgi:HYR domain
MKRKVAWALLTSAVLVGASLTYTRSASSRSSNNLIATPHAAPATPNLNLLFATTLTVDRTDDTAAATACTAAPNDCSLRGAVIAANTNPGAAPLVINLQPATTYNLTLTNATQENAAATGDLDITTSLHTLTIEGGGSSGPNATVIDAAGLNTGSTRDRVFHVTGSGVAVTFQDIVIRNGKAADDGTGGASTNPTAQNANRAGGGILNNGGSLTLSNVVVQSCQALGKGDSIVNEHTTLDAHGGGVASLATTGNVSITGSTLTGNAALGGDGGNFNNGAGSNAQGGSIYFEGGTLDIDGSRIADSSANGGNGGNQDQNGQTNGGFGGTAQGGGAWVGGGTVTINNTTFEDAEANGGNSGTAGNGSNPAGGADGGGLYSLGNVTVTNSTFHLAGAKGGDGGDAFGSTCLGGHQGGDGGGARGGAVFADGGSLIVNTVTFANNSADGGDGGDGGQTNGGLNCGMHGAGGLAYGGAIANNNAAAVDIKHATLSLNNAHAGNTGVNQGGANKPPRPAAEGTGGGVRVGPAGATFENTIIAGNTAANGAGDNTAAPTPGPDVDGAVTSSGHNLLGMAAEATGFNGTGDQTGADPLLSPLADNGGPTPTMALSSGSPAIDAGVAAGVSFDQRGKARTYDDPGVADAATSDGTDIGAFELQPLCSLSCPADFSVSNDPDACGAVVNYDTSYGAGCGTITCDHASGASFPVGDTTVTCTSSAGPSCSFKVTVNDTQNPTVSAPPAVSLNTDPDASSCGLFIADSTLGAASASDNCSASITRAGVPAGNVFPVGTTTITYTATDPAGHTATATQSVTVTDTQAPSVANLSADPSSLWPPNHTMRDVTVSYDASDNCGGVNCVVASVASNEPVNGAGDGNTAPDWLIVDSHHVQLRAERAGGGGRTYTITVVCTDSSGNTTTTTVTVAVPKSQS